MKGTTLGMTAKEVKALFGMHIVMDNLKFPQAHMYWAAATRVSLTADAMPPRDGFFRLRNALHVCNNECNIDENRCWKVQALLDRVRKACLKIPRSHAACVDEQMIPFTGRIDLRQYVQGKPNPTGLKNFVLADTLGRVLDFEIYQGARTSKHKDLGIGGGIVMRLEDTMPCGQNCHVLQQIFPVGAIDQASSGKGDVRSWYCDEKQEQNDPKVSQRAS